MRDEENLNAQLARYQQSDGSGRRDLSFSRRWVAGFAIAGAAIVLLDIYAHFFGRSIGLGIGLLVAAASQLLSRRWLDGSELHYRVWGRRHVLDLRDVTVVSTKDSGKQRLVQLSAPSLKKPLILGLRSYEAKPEVIQQLRFWLDAPQVQWSDEARAALGPVVGGQPDSSGRLVHGLLIGLIVFAVGTSVFVAVVHRLKDRSIAGAPGYERVGGPHGKGLAVGHPWGPRCQPVRFTVEESVPDWIYQEAAAVVAAARRDGINIAIETRDFRWDTSSLYFPFGIDTSTTPRVGIFANATTPSSGRFSGIQRITMEWDAEVDQSGKHEVLTEADGVLALQAINGSRPRVRRAIRNLIGLTQGIADSSRKDSVFAGRVGADGRASEYSQQDIKAMQTMSGCGTDAVSRHG